VTASQDEIEEIPLHPPIVLALGLANYPLIYGLAAASAPLIIHLLNKRKYREVPWAAMKFLLAAVRKNSRRIQIEQWILLAVRTLVIVFLVTAMAKPFLESMGGIAAIAGRRTHRVVVLDGSLSMAYTPPGETTRFDQAKALASQLIKDSRRGDSISLVLMADPPRVIIGDPSANRDEVTKELLEVTMPHGGTDLVASFNAIDRVLEASSIDQKEIIVVTDLQTASWRKPDAANDEALKRVVTKIEARKPRSVVIDLGAPGGENRAVTSLNLTEPVVTVGSPVLVQAVVRNYGPSASNGLRARLVVDGNLGEEKVVDVAVGEDQPIVFPHTFSAPGDHTIAVQIDDDPLKLDNRRTLAVPVREQVMVLLVDGDFKKEAYQAETDFLSQALSPESTSEGASSPIGTIVIPEGQLAGHDLTPYDAVILCNVAQFTEAEVASLDDFLRQGGGVVVFGGDQVIPDNYNRLLFADGKGLLPASIGPAVGDAGRKESSFGFKPLGYRHPILDEFAGEPTRVTSTLTGVKNWQFHKLKLPAESQAKVALAFDNDDPAIIESTKSRGTVIQVATSADSGWTNWPSLPSYVPIMEKIVLQAASGRMSERNVRVGQPLDQALPAAGAAASVSVLAPSPAPGGKTFTTKLQASDRVSLFHFEDTEWSGPYLVKIGPPLAIDSIFAANPDQAESDPAKLDRAGLIDAVPGWNFTHLTNWKELTGDAASVSRKGELHRPLLYLLLSFLLIESFLAWWFGHNQVR
jgi:hypothetical protein